MGVKSLRLVVSVASVVAAIWLTNVQVANAFDKSYSIPAGNLAVALQKYSAASNTQIVFDGALVRTKKSPAVVGRFSDAEALARLLANSGLTSERTAAGVIYIVERTIKPAPTERNRAEPLPEMKAHTEREPEIVIVTGSRLPTRATKAISPISVIPEEELRLSGAQTVEMLVGHYPQILGSQNNSSTGNTVPGGTVAFNARGLGEQRNLVLLNGRRFGISGTDQTVDLNAIPTSILKRVEMVTGGSSAVYGSDAVSGVVNFIVRNDFDGAELAVQSGWDDDTHSFTRSVDISNGAGFAKGRGHIALAFNFMDRSPILRGAKGGWAAFTAIEGCVTPETWQLNGPGTPLPLSQDQTCLEAGGKPGLVAGGSGDIPNGRFFGLPRFGSDQSNATLDQALRDAGLDRAGVRGFTFNSRGTQVRPALSPEDDYNTQPPNYLIIPLERTTLNAFGKFQLDDSKQVYFEGSLASSSVEMQLAPTNVNGTFLLDTRNPYLSSQMQAVLSALDSAEIGETILRQGTAVQSTLPNDGKAVIGIGRRMLELGPRHAVSQRELQRAVVGVKGNANDFTYDIYYSYAKTTNVDRLVGAVSRSRFAEALLPKNGQVPVLNVFGQNVSQYAATFISQDYSNLQSAEQQILAGNIGGEATRFSAGKVAFDIGFEWRRDIAEMAPDDASASGDTVGFTAVKPAAGKVGVFELYGEIRLPILANLPFVQRLNVAGAARYSNYTLKGVGGVWTYSTGVHWQIVPQLSARLQYQQAIRAPNIMELYSGNQEAFPSAIDPCSSRAVEAQRTLAVRTLCVATGVPSSLVFSDAVQPNGIVGNTIGGNSELRQENSTTETLGLVWTPDSGRAVAISVDYFKIEIDDAIRSLGGGIQGTLDFCYYHTGDAESVFCKAITRNRTTGEISGPTFVRTAFANTGGIRISGVDLAGRLNRDLSWGLVGDTSRLELTSAWTFTHEFIFTPSQATPEFRNDCAGAYGLTCLQPAPRWKGTTRLTWREGRVTLSLAHRYVGQVFKDTFLLPLRSGQIPPLYDSLVRPRIAPHHYFDMAFQWRIPEGLEVYGGVNNILDMAPPVVGGAPLLATYDPYGRTYFVGVRKKF